MENTPSAVPPPSNVPPPKGPDAKTPEGHDPAKEEAPKSVAYDRHQVAIPAIGAVLLVLLGIVMLVIWRMDRPEREEAAQQEQEEEAAQPAEPGLVSAMDDPEQKQVATKEVYVSEVPNAPEAFDIALQLPKKWKIEAASGDSINVYDPNAEGDTTLEQSQIFIKTFRASSFLTLSTVTIHERTDLTIADRPAVRYDIEKKTSAADFDGQPSWRNERHEVTDIRQSDVNPSTFFVFGRNPDVAEETFDDVLDSFETVDETGKASAAEENEPDGDEPPPAVTGFDVLSERVSKKPFGILIDPATSPVQPERFSGYHTAIDIEAQDIEEEVDVFAIADGTTAFQRTIEGYGGVTGIRHEIDGETLLGIYGHLDRESIRGIGDVKAGQKIGVLGEGFTSETDNERKHLHFGLYADEDDNVAGYVSRKSQLASWRDPLPILKNGYEDGSLFLPVDTEILDAH